MKTRRIEIKASSVHEEAFDELLKFHEAFDDDISQIFELERRGLLDFDIDVTVSSYHVSPVEYALPKEFTTRSGRLIDTDYLSDFHPSLFARVNEIIYAELEKDSVAPATPSRHPSTLSLDDCWRK